MGSKISREKYLLIDFSLIKKLLITKINNNPSDDIIIK